MEPRASASPPRMKARIAPCQWYVCVPLRSALNAWSTLRSGRCWTHGLHYVPVVAGRVVCTPFRSLLDACHRHAATPARSNTGTQQPSSYLGVIKCADTGSSKLAPVSAHLIAFIVNFHAALRAAPPRMKARWFRAYALHHLSMVCLRSTPVGAKRVVYTPFRSLLDKRSTFHFGRCWTRATGTQQHWRLATQARSAVLYVSPTAQLALIPSCRQMSAHPAKRACPSVRPLAELS